MKQINWSDITIKQFIEYQKATDIIQQVKAIYNIDIANIPIKDAANYINSLYPLKYPPKPKPPLINLKDYNIVLFPNKMCVAQYLDYNNCDKEDYLTLLSILVTPKGKSYNDYDIQQHKNTLSELFTVQDLIDLNYFFQLTSAKLLKYLLIYSNRLQRLKIMKNRLIVKIRNLKNRIIQNYFTS